MRVGLLGVGAVGFVLAGNRPGTATVWALAAYATIRFGIEALRGDRRPSVVGVSVARAMAVVQLLAAVLASEVWLVPGGPERRHLTAAVALAVVLVAGFLLDRRRHDPLAAWAHLDEMWSTIRTLAEVPPVNSRWWPPLRGVSTSPRRGATRVCTSRCPTRPVPSTGSHTPSV
ncbi:MAG: hypothetical protein ACRDRR_00480 [Pseudonocardiaceae bacterium]